MSQINEVVMCVSSNKHAYRQGLKQPIHSLRASGIDVDYPKPAANREQPETLPVLTEYVCYKCGHVKYI